MEIAFEPGGIEAMTRVIDANSKGKRFGSAKKVAKKKAMKAKKMSMKATKKKK